jgi:hypothetical protein
VRAFSESILIRKAVIDQNAQLRTFVAELKPSTMIPENMMAAMRGRISSSAQTGLRAATASFDDGRKHLRLDFFFSGTSENVDFEELEFGLVGEIIGDLWTGIDTVGFAVFFDGPSGDVAVANSARLFPA